MAQPHDSLPDPTKCPHGHVPGTCFYCGDLDEKIVHPDAHDHSPLDTPRLVEGKPELVTIGLSTEQNETKGGINEDAVLADARSQTYGVFDGMGGHAAGEIASAKSMQFVVEGLAQMPKDIRSDGARVAEYLRSALVQASENLRRMADADQALRGMGATAALIHLIESSDGAGTREAVVANVGDSRVYRMRGGILKRLTSDQSPIQGLIHRGELPSDADQIGDPIADAALTPTQREFVRMHRNQISGALGMSNVVIDVTRVPLERGDVLFATSDGVHDNLTDREIAALAENTAHDPAQFTSELIREARSRAQDTQHIRHKDDDISAVAVRIAKTAKHEKSLRTSAAPRTPQERSDPAIAHEKLRAFAQRVAEVPADILQEWQDAPTAELEKIAVEYRDILELHDQDLPLPHWQISRVHNMRTAFGAATTDAGRRVILRRDRMYKEAALDTIDRILAERANGAFADDYHATLSRADGTTWLAKYESRLRTLSHPNLPPDRLRGAVMRFQWKAGADEAQQHACLAAEREHVRRRIRQAQQSMRRAS